MGLSAALGIASRSLEIFSAGLQVAGQNVANANTPGYIRENLRLETAIPYGQAGLIFGTGVFAKGIVQEIDRFLEVRIHGANSDYNASSAREKVYLQLEGQIRELGEEDLSTSLSNFLSSIHEAVNQPESAAQRQLVLQNGQQLANDVASLRLRIDDLRKDQTVAVDELVAEANDLIRIVDDLNPKIARLEAGGILGSEAGALRTQRYNALNRLSEIVPIRFHEREDGGVDVFTGSDFLILTGQIQQLETFLTTDRNVVVQNIQLSETGSVIGVSGGGELRGIMEGRDDVLGSFVDDLDQFTSNLIDQFNRIHTSGEGLEGFASLTSATSVDDPTLALNAAGLSFTPEHGSFQVKVVNKLTGATVTTNVPVDLDGIGTDTTLNDLRTALDGIANLSAVITVDGRLQLDADPNFEFRFADDNSGTLAALGINTFFTGTDSSDIGVNSVVAGNQAYFAASLGGGPSDGRNALRMATFLEQPVAALGNVSLDDFYDTVVSKIGQKSSAESAITAGFKDFRDSLRNQREQFSGVSIDEEAVKILEFQRSFQASARIISTIDELFQTLIAM